MATTTRTALEVAMKITTQTDTHCLHHTYVEMPDLPRLLGKLTTTNHGSSYLILDLATGHNTHPGVRVDNTKTESGLLAQLVDELLTHLPA